MEKKDAGENAARIRIDKTTGGRQTMPDKKKLLFIIISLHIGGAERSLLNLLTLLPPEKYDIDLLLFRREGDFLDQIPPHVRLLEPPEDVERLYGSVKKSGRYMPVKVWGTALGKLMEPKVFEGRLYRWKHVYSRALHTMPGHWNVAAAYLEGEPTYYVADFVSADKKLCWVHNDYLSLSHDPKYDAPAFRKMDQIVTISSTCLDVLRKTFPELADKMRLVENISSSSVVRRQAEAYMPEEYAAGGFNILSVGRLTEQKGFDMAIDAAAKLKKKGLRFCWHIMGNGEKKDELTAQIDKQHVSDCVKLIGIRSNPYPYMLHADLLAQTSRWEGKSVVLDEAKMIGVPILCTRYKTAENQIIDGKDGVIVPVSADGIAEGIEGMIRDEARRRQMISYQRAHDYDNRSELARYEQLFDEV